VVLSEAPRHAPGRERRDPARCLRQDQREAAPRRSGRSGIVGCWGAQPTISNAGTKPNPGPSALTAPRFAEVVPPRLRYPLNGGCGSDGDRTKEVCFGSGATSGIVRSASAY